MANYTTNTSDKSKQKAIKLLLSGGVGLHLFYAGKIRAGIVRFILGIGVWAILIGSIVSPETWGTADTSVPMVLICLIMLIIFNIADLTKLLFGKFRDNVGDYLRA